MIIFTLGCRGLKYASLLSFLMLGISFPEEIKYPSRLHLVVQTIHFLAMIKKLCNPK